MIGRGSRPPSTAPTFASVLDTGRSTLKLLLEVWYTLWHEAHH